MSKNKKISLFIFTTIIIIVVFFSIYFLWLLNNNFSLNDVNDETNIISDQERSEEDNQPISDIQEDKDFIVSKKILDVGFIPQAPKKNWEEPWQNACEEAAVLNAYYYLEGRKDVNIDIIERDILAMIDWEINYFGSHKDLNVEEVAMMVEKYLEYKVKRININTTGEIEKEITDGNPVIIPAAGRILENEHFTEPAPIYHMLTIIGFSDHKFITNDPGTQFGRNFEYSYENLLLSIHDFIEGADEEADLILQGEKLGLVLIKK